MKLLPTSLAIFLFLFNLSLLKAQSFEKHTALLEIKLGLGIFGTVSSNDFSGPGENGAAALTILPITFEYGVTNWLGVGGLVEASHYIQNQDSVKAGKGIKGNSYEIGPLINAHFLRSSHADLYTGIKLAYSSLKISGNEPNSTILKSGGTMFNLCIGSRFIIGNHFAFSTELGYTNYNYPNGEIANDPSIQNVGFSLALNGVDFLVGLGYKF